MKNKFCMMVCLLFSLPTAHSFGKDATAGTTVTSARKGKIDTVAGNAYSHVAIGIEAGANFAYMPYFLISSDFTVGGRAGIVFDIPLSPKVYIQPGLFYAMTGASGKVSFSANADEVTVYVNTIELPAMCLFRVGHRDQFFLGGGIFLARNISGHLVSALKIGSRDGDDLKAMDDGLKICVGHQSKSGFLFKAAFQKGVANLDPYAGGPRVTTTSINLDFGFMFGERRKH